MNVDTSSSHSRPSSTAGAMTAGLSTSSENMPGSWLWKGDVEGVRANGSSRIRPGEITCRAGNWMDPVPTRGDSVLLALEEIADCAGRLSENRRDIVGEEIRRSEGGNADPERGDAGEHQAGGQSGDPNPDVPDCGTIGTADEGRPDDQPVVLAGDGSGTSRRRYRE